MLIAVLVLMAAAGGALADDPERRHELDELTLRQGAKPWTRMLEGDVFPTERTIFRDTVTGAQTWRLTDDTREGMHDYYDKSVWNSVGSHLIFLRQSDLFETEQWVQPADGSWTRPVQTVSLEALENGDRPEEAVSGAAYWSWEDPGVLINESRGLISLVDPMTAVHTVIFDLMSEPVNEDPQLPVLEPGDFKLMPPHPLDDRLLLGTHPKGRIFSFDMAALELAEMPTDGRWEVPESTPGAITIHRLRWTKSPTPTLFIAQDTYNDGGELVIDERQYTAALDGQLTEQILAAHPERRAGHPDLTMDGGALTGTYTDGKVWRLSIDSVTPERIIFDAPSEQHHASCSWDDRWLVSDTPDDTGANGLVLRGFETRDSNALVSGDGRSQSVVNYHYASYVPGAESTHPGPTSSPDGTKLAYDSDMLARAEAGGGDGDGNPDLWMVVVRPPAQPRAVSAKAKTDWVEVTWDRPLHAESEIYWNPGNLSREIAGYNVFRGLASGGPYEQINAELVVGEEYLDESFELGVSYYYVVQAVEHSGLVSLYSQESYANSASRRYLGDVLHYYEAESAELTLPMVMQFDALGASGDWFVGTFAQEPDPTFPIEAGPAAVTFEVTTPVGGRYGIWARVRGFDFGGSFDVEVDGNVQSTVIDVPSGDWTWVELGNTVRIGMGAHSLILRTDDPEIGVDRIAMMLGGSGPPPTGGNADIVAPAPPSDPVLVSIDGSTKKLDWTASPDADVAYYNVYCGRNDSYEPGNSNLLRSPIGTSVYDWGIPAGLETVYKITAVDRYGNESEEIVLDPGSQGEGSAPVAVDDAYETSEDQMLDVPAPGVLANDTDEDGDELTAVLLSDVSHGTLILGDDGGFTYTPDFEYSGEDSFTYAASDGLSTSDLATVTISIGDVADPPVAVDDAFSANEDEALSVAPSEGLLANDSDPEGDALTVVLVTGPAHGLLELGDTGGLAYWPDADFNGSDSFTYVATDGVNDSNVATVTLTVAPAEDLPDADADQYAVLEDSTLDMPAPGVLTNDTDADGDPLTAVLVTTTTNGTLALNANGGFVYIPSPDFCGNDWFTYLANDGKGDSVPVSVLIEVECVDDDSPQAFDDAYETAEDTLLRIAAPGVMENDIEMDGVHLEAVLVSDAANGTVNLRTSGSFSYSPAKDFAGTDSFTYLLTDGVVTSNVATVTLTVHGGSDSPSASSDTYSLVRDGFLDVASPGVLANDSDSDGDPLQAFLVSGPANGTLSLDPDGGFFYTPDPGFAGVDEFFYVADDGTSSSPETSVRLQVRRQ